MEETVCLQNRGAAEKPWKLYQTITPARVLQTCRDAVRTVGGPLVKSEFSGTLCNIEEIWRAVFDNALQRLKESDHIKRLVSAVGADVVFALTDLLRMQMGKNISERSTLQHVNLQFPA